MYVRRFRDGLWPIRSHAVLGREDRVCVRDSTRRGSARSNCTMPVQYARQSSASL